MYNIIIYIISERWSKYNEKDRQCALAVITNVPWRLLPIYIYIYMYVYIILVIYIYICIIIVFEKKKRATTNLRLLVSRYLVHQVNS